MASGVTNVVGGDGGARMTVAEGVVLHETCTWGTTDECRDSVGGARVGGVRQSVAAVRMPTRRPTVLLREEDTERERLVKQEFDE